MLLSAKPSEKWHVSFMGVVMCEWSVTNTLYILWVWWEKEQLKQLLSFQLVFTFSVLTQTAVGPVTANILLFIIWSLHFKAPPLLKPKSTNIDRVEEREHSMAHPTVIVTSLSLRVHSELSPILLSVNAPEVQSYVTVYLDNESSSD